MKLAERLKELRKERNLRQEQVAVALDIGMATYCRYEQGKREPDASVLWRMADFYGVSVDYLLGREEERGPDAYAPRGEVPALDLSKFQWTRRPGQYSVKDGQVEIVTRPHTDLWQRTYYHFRNDNAPVFQMETEERYFSFVVKTAFPGSHHRFDQCGVVLYLDSENWLKGSIEYENDRFQHLGSVVTNLGWSDWATTEIDAGVKSMWYRLSRREDDYCIECSEDGAVFRQMRVCHLHKGGGRIRFGVYACSPEDSSFTAVFSHMELQPCQWAAHDGQQPDEEVQETP